MGARQFGEKLVESRPDVVGELHFDDGLEAHGGHADGASDDEGLLDGRVEDAVVAELLGQGRGFAEDAAQAASDVLAVHKGFGVGFEDFAHGEQGAVDHHRAFTAGGLTGSALGGHRGWRHAVGKQVARRGIRSRQGAFVVGLHACAHGVHDCVEFGRLVAVGEQGRAKLGVGIAGSGLVKVVAVPLHAYA